MADTFGGGATHATRHVNGSAQAASGAIPKLSGDIRPLIPKLGLREYWYPALPDREVGARKPAKVSLLGDDVLPVPRRHRQRGGHPGRLSASRRAAQRG